MDENNNNNNNDNYFLLSSIRPGLKREFAFAMKSHSENYLLLDRRTRGSRKLPESQLPNNKKSKLGHDDEEEEDESKSDVVDTVIESGPLDENEVKGEPLDDEMKMKKKSGGGVVKVKKFFPVKLKELLETGLLEGLNVRYIRGTKV